MGWQPGRVDRGILAVVLFKISASEESDSRVDVWMLSVFKNAGIVFCVSGVNWVITVCASKKSQNNKVRHRVRRNIGRLPVNNCFIIWALPFWMNYNVVYIIYSSRNRKNYSFLLIT
ncbi:hypothetical protein D7V86_09255 [bacterium D16-51]|nr:hypothetical protein D7V96_09755 [bacterium D16-59]RKI60382.1 hypothetical protein D7V86_09255 [bacterium D16-51]